MKQLLLYLIFPLLFFTPNIPVSLIGGEEAVVCSDLVVEIERDCSNAEETETYTLTVIIHEGVPPFIISGSIEATLDDIGEVSTVIEDGLLYEINIVDADGNEFYETGGEISCIAGCYDFNVEDIADIANCLCNGDLVFHFENIINASDSIDLSGVWGNNTIGQEIALGDTIPTEMYMSIQANIYSNYKCYEFYFQNEPGLSGYVSNLCTPENYTLEAIGDFFLAESGQTLTIHPLQNDTGTNLQINQIVTYPSCGEILEVNQETGEIVYIVAVDTNCSFDTFVYETVDECGNILEATVTVVIHQEEDYLWVDVILDCTGFCFTDSFIVDVGISGGTPPYFISGSITDTLEEAGWVSTNIGYNDEWIFEIEVVDSAGDEYYYSNFWFDFPCQGGCCSYFEISSLDEIAECLADGSMVLTLEGIPNNESISDIGGQWYNGDETNDLVIGDTIPSNAVIELAYIYTNIACYYFEQEEILLKSLIADLCLSNTSMIEARSDVATTNPTEPVTLNVLENDLGESIFIKQIIQAPSCGEATIIDANLGTIRYTPEPNCFLSTVPFEYLIEDNQGNQALALVHVVITGEESELAVVVERDCFSVEGSGQYLLNITIAEGTPPFTISGTLNTTLQEIGVIKHAIEDGLMYEISVIDGVGNEFFEIGGEISCDYLSPYIVVNKLPDIASCTCEGGLIFDFEGLDLSSPIMDMNGHWESSSGEHIPIELGVAIPPNVSFRITRITLEDGYYYLRNGANYNFIEGNTSNFCPTPCIEAHTDLTTTSSSEPITFNVLENDIGEGIFIKGITKPPFCGTAEIVDAQAGIVQYTPDASCSEKLLSFDYQIEDIDGNSAIGTVKIVINQGESELVVAVERDCCADVHPSGVYPLNVYIVDGVPPFTVSGNINTIMEDFGVVTIEIEDGVQYEIAVVDATGNEFHEIGGEIPCNSLGGNLCSEIAIEKDYIVEEGYLGCLCDGSLIVSFAPLAQFEEIQSIYGFWYLDDEIQPIEWGDTIPPNTHFQIFEVQTNYSNYLVSTLDDNDLVQNFWAGNTSDFCPTPCIEAHTDLITTSPTESITFNILENDIGEGIFINEITQQPLCGTLEVVDAELGEIRYTPDIGCLLGVDNFEYEIEDIEGNRASAIVKVVLNRSGNDLAVMLEIDCSNVEQTGIYTLNVTIIEGVPPFIISGSTNNLLEDFGTVSVVIEEGLPFEISVIDAVGNEFHQTGGDAACMTFGPQARLHHIDQIGSCLCDGSLLVNFDNLETYGETITGVSGYWIDENGNEASIELGSIIPFNHFFLISHVLMGNSGYILLTKDILKSPQGFPSNFCPLQTPPIATLNESESQTLICGEGEIILSAEDAGEGAVYNWYLDESSTIPASPPTGQIWINDEIVGPRIIYLVVTESNGCQSEPLPISTYSYEAITAEDLEIEIEAQNCDHYRISFKILGGNGVYTVNEKNVPPEFISEWISIEEEYHFVIDDSPLIPNCEPITINGSIGDYLCPPLAIDDFGSSYVGQTVQINLLSNDTGENIQFSSIVTPPSCGEITNIDTEAGTITYLPTDCNCNFDTFTYEIIDENGQTSQGIVTIILQNVQDELIAQAEVNCDLSSMSENYILEVHVQCGVAPFTISGSINQTLEDWGTVSDTFEISTPYTIEIVDAEGQQLILQDENPCTHVSISNTKHPTPNIQLFPNPNDGNFTLSLQLEQMENIEIEVVDILGKAKIRRHSQSSATFEQQLNLNLPSGLYFLQVSGENWRWIEKVIVR